MKNPKIRAICVVILIFCIACVAFIWRNSLENGEVSNGRSDKYVGFLEPFIDPLGILTKELESIIVRKMAHFLEYAALGILASTFYLSVISFDKCKISKSALFVPLSVAIVASVDETIQKFTGRSSEIKDVILDCIGGGYGILFTVVIFFFVLYMIKRGKRSATLMEKEVKE